ncbi:hypothetical protein BP5796_05629 [Coleophoma crateriformis]|uniref:Major facilitator superfamily (MFS) profile domain-containing protein n=1 Tax=Coleophoma crateriformis TaxID=565419 RepID=A0A3D8S4A6_9HELO|nr:hypothetical protein BP5796_05629 [Coleophoma crateriformis]
MNGAQALCYLFFGSETLYMPSAVLSRKKSYTESLFNFRRIDPEPLTGKDFYGPLLLLRYTSVIVPTISYTISFAFVSVLMAIEIPQLMGQKFELNAQQIGLQFAGMIIGCVIGEQIGGPMSDFFMNRRAKVLAARPPPAYRLWSCYLGILTVIAGIVIFMVQLQNTEPLHWNVTPIVGVAIASFGLQIMTTVLITYMVDSNPSHSSSIGVGVEFVRQAWGFIGPFWFPNMFASLGLPGSAGLMVGIVLLCSMLPVAILQFRGLAVQK